MRAKNGVKGLRGAIRFFAPCGPSRCDSKPAGAAPDRAQPVDRRSPEHHVSRRQRTVHLASCGWHLVRAVEYNPTARKAEVGDRVALQSIARDVIVLPRRSSMIRPDYSQFEETLRHCVD